jgi:signal transduction histidine kinase
LALLFALGSGSLLLVSAAFLYVNLNRQLQSAVDRGLEQRADDIAADVTFGPADIRQQEAFAEIIAADGRVLDASSTISADHPVISASTIRRATNHRIFLNLSSVPDLGEHARLLARPVKAQGTTVVVLVGSSRDAIDRAQSRLALFLLVTSPVLVGALSGGGWLLAGAALRPVERMIEEADAISLTEVGRRLPIPPGDDELTHLGRTLNDMLDRIEASFARERAFVDDASHELRTPISIIQGELEVALMRPDLDAEMRATLQSSLEEAERLGRLASDLLSLARVSAGSLAVHREPIDVHALVTKVAERLSDDHGPVVSVDGPHVVIEGDVMRLEQVITNLVTNARRHAHENVGIHLSNSDHGIDVEVADDGDGFPSDLLPVVFDRFSRGDPARGREAGTGLGLAIASAVVRAHGGTIAAGNGDPLGGAVVRVHLPTDMVPA